MNAPQFKIKKHVTLPVLQLKPGAPTRFLKIATAMRLGEKLDDQKSPATLLEAVDLVTGEYGNVVCPTIMQKELNRNYPGESYVGKSFAVTVTRDVARKYNHVFLAEVDLDPDAVEESAEAAPTEVVPTEAVPTEAAPTEAAPTEAAPTEAVPTEAASVGKRRR